jgi:hypothetical protein
VIALNPGKPALAAFQTGDLFAFAVQLLDLPAIAAHLLRRRRRMLSTVVGHDPIRAVGRHLNPEPLPFVVFGKAFDLDGLAVSLFSRIPAQRTDALVRLCPTGIIHLAVRLEGAIIDFLQGLDEQHQVFGGIPTVHQHGLERQALVIDGIAEHVMDMIELGFAVAIGIVEPVVDQPERIQLRIHIDAGDDADAADQAMGIATVLAAHQVDLPGEVLIQHGVVKEQITGGYRDNLGTDVIPYQPRRHPFTPQVTVDGIMTEGVIVIGKIGQRVVDLADQQKLAIV